MRVRAQKPLYIKERACVCSVAFDVTDPRDDDDDDDDDLLM